MDSVGDNLAKLVFIYSCSIINWYNYFGEKYIYESFGNIYIIFWMVLFLGINIKKIIRDLR